MDDALVASRERFWSVTDDAEAEKKDCSGKLEAGAKHCADRVKHCADGG